MAKYLIEIEDVPGGCTIAVSGGEPHEENSQARALAMGFVYSTKALVLVGKGLASSNVAPMPVSRLKH